MHENGKNNKRSYFCLCWTLKAGTPSCVQQLIYAVLCIQLNKYERGNMNKKDKEEVIKNIIEIIKIAEKYMTPLNYIEYKKELLTFINKSVE